MLINHLTRLPEPIERKGSVISDSAAIAERLEDAIARIEVAIARREAEIARREAENARREAENERLRRVEAAAAAALADLDALIGDDGEQRRYG